MAALILADQAAAVPSEPRGPSLPSAWRTVVAIPLAVLILPPLLLGVFAFGVVYGLAQALEWLVGRPYRRRSV